MARKILNSKSIVLATAAHDLRNPLSAIFGYSEALLMEPGEHSLSARQRDLVHRIRGATLRALEFSKNLQSLAHSDAKRARKIFSLLMPGINNAIESVWFPPEKDLSFSTASSLDSTARVGLEHYEVERIVANLLSNAIKFSPGHAKIDLQISQEGRNALIAVRNTGSTIPARERATIFKIFARGSNARTLSGSGLGLAIVDSLVKRAKGKVSLTSNSKFTTFEVRLPLASNKRKQTK